jgi:N-acetylneuraminic acid mutarotase
MPQRGRAAGVALNPEQESMRVAKRVVSPVNALPPRSAALARAVRPLFERLEGRQLMAVQPAADWVEQGGGATGAVTLGIHFGPDAQPVNNHAADDGAAFAAHPDGLAYGWDAANTARAARTGAAGDVFQSFNSFAVGRVWELSVPDGTYQLRVVSGDAARPGAAPSRVRAEGDLILFGRTSGAQPFLDASATVTVRDGRLTLNADPAAPGTAINFIELKRLDPTLPAPADETPTPAPTPAPTPTPTPTPTPSPTPTGPAAIAWSNGPAAPYAVQESLTVQVGNRLFMWGGFLDNDHNVSTQGWALDLDRNTWSRLADSPAGQSHVGVAADEQGRCIYFAGGIDDTGHRKSVDTAFRYDIADDKFETFTKLPAVRVGGAMAVVDGWLHYIGGDLADRVTPTDEHFAIRLDANGSAVGTWQRRAKMVMPSDHHSAVVIDGKIYAVGGEEGHSTTYIQHDTMSVYDPATDAWTALAPLPRASSHFEGGTVLVHGRIVVMGGQAAGEKIINDVKVYDPVSNTWQNLNDMPGTRKGGDGAFWNGRLYYTTGRGVENGSRQNFANTWIGSIRNPWW